MTEILVITSGAVRNNGIVTWAHTIIIIMIYKTNNIKQSDKCGCGSGNFPNYWSVLLLGQRARQQRVINVILYYIYFLNILDSFCCCCHTFYYFWTKLDFFFYWQTNAAAIHEMANCGEKSRCNPAEVVYEEHLKAAHWARKHAAGHVTKTNSTCQVSHRKT